MYICCQRDMIQPLIEKGYKMRLAELPMEFPRLINEVNYLNKAYGWSGFRDALTFIEEHSTHYEFLAEEFNEFTKTHLVFF